MVNLMRSRIGRTPWLLVSWLLAAGLLGGAWLAVTPAPALAAAWLRPAHRPAAPGPLVQVCFAEITGDNTTDYASADAAAVRQALAAVPAGATVKLAGNCAGAVSGGGTPQLAAISRTVTVIGGYTATNWLASYPLTQPTTLNAQGAGRVLSITAPATLQNLWLTGGIITDASGGGLYASQAITLTGVTLFHNQATGASNNRQGGGAYLAGVAVISGSTFVSNTSYAEGGGAYVGAGGSQLINSDFLSNTSTNGEAGGLRVLVASAVAANGLYFFNNIALGGGGGAASWDGPGFLLNSLVQSNTAAGGPGGGIYFNLAASIGNTRFVGNHASLRGGGATLHGGGTITDGTFADNQAGTVGGGVDFNAPGTLISPTVTGNQAATDGGGAYFDSTGTVTGGLFLQNAAGGGGQGGGLHLADDASLVDMVLISNSAGQGGGAYIEGVANLKGDLFTGNAAATGGALVAKDQANLYGLTFRDNQADLGGGVYLGPVSGQTRAITNTLFAGNVAHTNLGAAIYSENTGHLDIVHVSIASPGITSGSAVYSGLSETVHLTNTIIASYTIGIQSAIGTIQAGYILFDHVATPYSGTVSAGGHTLTGTAGFVNPAAGNYHLTEGSAAIDAGVDAGVAFDLDGVARPQGGGFDLGAYEFVKPIYELWMPLVER